MKKHLNIENINEIQIFDEAEIQQISDLDEGLDVASECFDQFMPDFH